MAPNRFSPSPKKSPSHSTTPFSSSFVSKPSKSSTIGILVFCHCRAIPLRRHRHPRRPAPREHPMALGDVELILAIETEFGVHIPMDDVVRFERLGDIHEWLVELLRHTSNDSEDDIWERLHRVTVRELGIRPREVTKSARMLEDLN